jgi:hypothetical protein
MSRAPARTGRAPSRSRDGGSSRSRAGTAQRPEYAARPPRPVSARMVTIRRTARSSA